MPYKDPEKRKQYIKKHYQKNREGYLKMASERRMRLGYDEYMRPIQRTSHLKRRYGITDAEYMQLLEKQNYRCAVCGTANPSSGKNNYFDVDHDHNTGIVRGLLCRNCNVTLGVLEKKHDLLVLLQAYVLKFKPLEYDPKPKKEIS